MSESKIRLYGFYKVPSSNPIKVAMALEELGLKYEYVVLDKETNEHGGQEHLKRQPNGKVPVLQDGDLNIFESGAILFYLVNKYDTDHKIWSSDPGVQAEIMSWVFLQVTSLGPNVWQFLNWEHRSEMRDARPVFHSEILRILGILEERLSRPGTNGWISSHGCSIADICWAPLVDGWKQKRCHFDLEDFPAIKKWSDNVYGREAVKRAYHTAGLFFGDRAGYPKS